MVSVVPFDKIVVELNFAGAIEHSHYNFRAARGISLIAISFNPWWGRRQTPSDGKNSNSQTSVEWIQWKTWMNIDKVK